MTTPIEVARGETICQMSGPAGLIGGLPTPEPGGPHPYQAYSRDAFMLEERDMASSAVA
jgi:hypothetical protein